MIVNYSYHLLEVSKVWRWKVISPGGQILSEGAADTRVRAAAEAMQTWLDMTEEQGHAKKRIPANVCD